MRIRKQNEFKHVIATGRRAADASLTVFAAANDRPHSRLGISIGRKFGNAVRRNRAKRLLREAFRLQQHELPKGIDIVCIVRPVEEPLANLQDYSKCLADLVQRVWLKH